MSPTDSPNVPLPNLPNFLGKLPTFGSPLQGKKPKSKSPVATYLGPDAQPSVANVGTKALVGQ